MHIKLSFKSLAQSRSKISLTAKSWSYTPCLIRMTFVILFIRDSPMILWQPDSSRDFILCCVPHISWYCSVIQGYSISLILGDILFWSKEWKINICHILVRKKIFLHCFRFPLFRTIFILNTNLIVYTNCKLFNHVNIL